MTTDPALQRLFEIVKKDSALIEQNLITVHDGIYHVFGRFEIRCKTPNQYLVSKHGETKAEFGSLSAALSWCIAEKLHNYRLSRDIQQLDRQCTRLSDDLDTSDRLINRSRDHVYRDLVMSKTVVKKQALKITQSQLSKCVAVAKYFQTKGFNDEIARTRRITQDTTTVSHIRKPNRTKV